MRRSWDSLIFILEIHILERRYLYIVKTLRTQIGKAVMQYEMMFYIYVYVSMCVFLSYAMWLTLTQRI